MKKLLDANIVGLLPVPGGFFYIQPNRLPDGKVKGEFYGYDAANDKAVPITKWVYFEAKFGDAYKEITSQVKDYVSCECGILTGGEAVLLYPDGDFGVFNARGIATFTGKLEYHGEIINGVAPDGRNFWGVVPTMNAVIQFQRVKGLPETGVVNLVTWNALMADDGKTPYYVDVSTVSKRKKRTRMLRLDPKHPCFVLLVFISCC